MMTLTTCMNTLFRVAQWNDISNHYGLHLGGDSGPSNLKNYVTIVLVQTVHTGTYYCIWARTCEIHNTKYETTLLGVNLYD